MNAGKWLILGMLGVAVAAGIAAWMIRYNRTDAIQAFWGERALSLIASAPEVDALRRADHQTAARRRATIAKGMLSVRYMLGSDFAYQWPAEEGLDRTDNHWGLEFRRESERFLIDFNRDCTCAWEPKTGKTIALVPAAAESLRAFFEERFDDNAARGTSAGGR